MRGDLQLRRRGGRKLEDEGWVSAPAARSAPPEGGVLSVFSREAATMVRISVLADALKTMYNAEKRGKR
jgi:hypothetical protein